MKKQPKKLVGKTPLEKNVANFVNKQAADYERGIVGVLEDLFNGGCESGYVGHLIYYSDTCRFFKRNQVEISALLGEMLDDLDAKSPADIFGDKWDRHDPLALDVQNQNLLAWFGFEETARKMAYAAGYEV